MNIDLKKNLILIKELYQEKVLLELLKNVLVIMIINIMQLNELNNKKNKLILKKLKQDYKYKMNKTLLINKIFIIDNVLEIIMKQYYKLIQKRIIYFHLELYYYK